MDTRDDDATACHREEATTLHVHVHVPLAVVETTRALLWVQTAADARLATEKLVRQLGGAVVSAALRDPAGDHTQRAPLDLARRTQP